MPSLYMMSNSASVNGGATLFFTILTLRAVARDRAVGRLDRADAADIDAHAGVELQRLAARGRFGIAEHHADLFADLVGENAAGARLGDERSELAHRRAHQAGLRADRGVADLALEFRLSSPARRRSRAR